METCLEITMDTCPYCSNPIPSSYFVEGGICDHCGQLILGEEDLIEDEPTSHLLQDDMPTDETTLGEGIIRPNRSIKPLFELEIDEDFGVQIDRLTQSLPAHAMGETVEDIEHQKDNTVNIAVPGKRRKERGGNGPMILGSAVFLSIAAIVWFAYQNPNEEFRRFTGISIFFPDQERHVDSMKIEEEKEEIKKTTRRRRQISSTQQSVSTTGANSSDTTTNRRNGSVAPSSIDDLGSLLMPTVSANSIEVDSIGSGPKKTDDQITNEFQRKLGQLKICHARATKQDDNVRGRWKIKVTVNADGSTSNFNLTPERDSNDILEGCIREKGAAWTFSAPGDSIPLETTLIYN